jgi:hypothetical protein
VRIISVWQGNSCMRQSNHELWNYTSILGALVTWICSMIRESTSKLSNSALLFAFLSLCSKKLSTKILDLWPYVQSTPPL